MTQPGDPQQRRLVYFHHSAGAVVIAGGECLVMRVAGRDEWVFPKGHIEEDESAAEAAIREVREEAGIAIRIVREIGASRYAFGRAREHRKRVEWFLAEPLDRVLRIEPIFGDAAFVGEAEAQHLLTHRADRQIAERAFALMRGEQVDGPSVVS